MVFKKTTIKDDGARRKHMLQDAESRKEEEEKGKKHKCKDYVIIGDPGTELKKRSVWTSSTRTLPVFCCF